MLVIAGLLAMAGLGASAANTPPFKGALTIEPALGTGKCLTAASNSDGAAVTIEPCTYGANQKWIFEGGNVKVFGNKCLDVSGGSSADGTLLQIWTCTANNANQRFKYTVWVNQLAWDNGQNKCVELPGGNTASGTRIAIYGCVWGKNTQNWTNGYNVKELPQTSQSNQYGTNNCGTASNQTSNCQTAYMNSAEDFCLWGPPDPNSTIGDTEHKNVAWCTKSGRGTRVIPNGALKGVHFVRTPNYVQVTGVGDFTLLNIKKGDSGGELDNRGADGNGNPAGGLVYGNTFGVGTQYHEWTSFISENEFCFRACVGGDAMTNCNHIYDLMGCYWNMPANYDAGVFETCDANNDLPMGVYGTSTWSQGTSPTPEPHPAASSSNCVSVPTVAVAPAPAKRSATHKRREHHASFPTPTPF
ncbi:hypothetical protein DXG01_012273 [Tephrocybe rancida]|nr:hypothetical protein DXG01_012273 [Tephrocybe rancida]